MRVSGDLLARAGDEAVRRRWWVIGAVVVLQWGILWREALHSIHHNGWLYAHGDDGTWYWTTAWAQTSLHVPVTAVGMAWPYLLTPLAAVFGPDMADGMPAVIALNVLLLAPAAVVGMYLLGERIAGRLFGLWSAVLFAVLPVVAIALYNPRNRPVVVDFFLPTATGLNDLSDFPSMVCAIYCAWLTLRAFDTRTLADGALAGVAVGFLVLLKPANGPLAVTAVAFLLVTLRRRPLAGMAAAGAPAALALLLWKRIGTGGIPALSSHTGGEATGAPAVAHNARRYLNIDFTHLAANAGALREVFWSLRLLEFLLLAGAVGLVLRARWRGAFVVAWFLAYGLVKGTVPYSSVYDTSVYRFLLPAWPAWVLIVGGVVFCWPVGRDVRGTRTEHDRARGAASLPLPRLALPAALVVLSLLPLALVAALREAPRGAIVQQNWSGAPVPARDVGLTARTGANAVELRWRPFGSSRAATRYAVFKAGDPGCFYESRAATSCLFRMVMIGSTDQPSFTDRQPRPHRYYRVALVAGRTVQVDNPAILVISKPLSVTAG